MNKKTKKDLKDLGEQIATGVDTGKLLKDSVKQLIMSEKFNKMLEDKKTDPKFTTDAIERKKKKKIKALKSMTSDEAYSMPEKKKQNPMSVAKGGMIKGYMGGGSVHKNKINMITTKGWGASRKT